MIHSLLCSGTFQDDFELANVNLLMKKILPTYYLGSYRFVLNLSFISNILEATDARLIRSHICFNRLRDVFNLVINRSHPQKLLF